MEEQREVDRRSVETEVEKPLGHIQCRGTFSLDGSVSGLLRAVVHKTVIDKLVLADCRDRKLVVLLEALLDVVGPEGGVLSDQLDVFTSKRKDVGVGPQNHAEVAQESGHLSGGLLTAFSVLLHITLAYTGTSTNLELTIFILDHLRNRQVRNQFLADTDRA